MTLYPWQQEAWRRLPPNARLPHALLLQGLPGIGKTVFAHHLAMRLLCANGTACGHCRSCHLVTATTHPDLLILAASGGKHEITIDDVRTLGDFIGLRAHLAHCRVAVIDNADQLNRAAANAMLKLLEEPPADVYILLVSHGAGHLPPTLRSRCQRWILAVPPVADARQFLVANGHPCPDAALARARGAPLAALARPMAATDVVPDLQKTLDDIAVRRVDVVAAADHWHKAEYESNLLVLADIVGDLIRCGHGIGPLSGGNPAWLQAWVIRLDLRQVFQLWDRALRAGRDVVETPLDKRLIWEDIFLTWERLATKGRNG